LGPLVRLLLIVTLAAMAIAAPATGQCTGNVQKLFEERDYDAARRDAEALAKRNGNDAAAHYCVGRIAYAQGQSNKAVDWFEKALDRDVSVSAYHLWLGNALGEEAQKASKLRQPFLARRVKSEFETAVRLDPRNIDARHGLIQFYSVAPGVMGGSMAKAKEQAAEIGKLNRMRGHLELAALLEKEKDVAGAERELGAALTAASDSAAPYYALANFHARQQHWDVVFETLDHLMKARPDEMSAKLSYARVAYLSGQNLERGELEAKSWLAAPPADASPVLTSAAHTRLGAIYDKQGRLDEARREYEKGLELNPRNEEAKRGAAKLRKD
jgi:tetratricopeptide (TPR) repeat protein